jgi:hypothetical protein
MQKNTRQWTSRGMLIILCLCVFDVPGTQDDMNACAYDVYEISPEKEEFEPSKKTQRWTQTPTTTKRRRMCIFK